MEAALNKIRVNRYPAYKDSGVEWLGEIPVHWDIEIGKWLFKKEERPTRPFDDIVTCFRDGQVTLRSNRRVDGFTNAIYEFGYQGIRRGDFVIHSMDAFAGAIGVSDSDGKSSPVYLVCTPRNSELINSYYYAFYLRQLALSGFIESLAKGIRERSTDFRFSDFSKIKLPLPPVKDQNSIVKFLTQKTAQIDKAIAQKERVIELLKEKRQILIQRAVTRGLDPKVKMKDSGVEWIGEIPEHWKIKALKYIAFLQSGMTISSDSFTEDGFPVYGGNGFRGYTSTYTNEGQFALVGRQGALCGNVNYAKGKFFASEHAIVVYPKDKENYFWLGETIRIADFNRLSQSAAQPGIAVNVVKNVLFPYPPVYEQSLIAQYLEKVYLKIDKTVSFKETEIEKLKEFKATLINSVVTGKIKV